MSYDEDDAKTCERCLQPRDTGRCYCDDCAHELAGQLAACQEKLAGVQQYAREKIDRLQSDYECRDSEVTELLQQLAAAGEGE